MTEPTLDERIEKLREQWSWSKTSGDVGDERRKEALTIIDELLYIGAVKEKANERHSTAVSELMEENARLKKVAEAAKRARRAMFIIDGEDSIRALLKALDEVKA